MAKEFFILKHDKIIRRYFTLCILSFDQKVHNVAFAFELMQDSGLPKPKARPEGDYPFCGVTYLCVWLNNFAYILSLDIVNLDLKSTLRVLYNLFTKYKHVN